MHTFTGQSEHKLDAKGRLFLPRRLSDSILDPQERTHFQITIGQDPCLYLFTPAGFHGHLEGIRRAVQGTEEFANVMRGVSGLTSTQSLDGQGRLLLPEALRHHAHLAKEVVVLGVFDHIEIWDVDLWQERAAGARDTYLEQAAIFFRGGQPSGDVK